MYRYIIALSVMILFTSSSPLLAMQQKIDNHVLKYTEVDRAPILLTEISPNYPEEALKNHMEGSVVLRLTVGTDGHVHDIKVIKSTDKIFEKPAIDAAKNLLFKPGQKDGKNVTVSIVMPIMFKIR